MKRRDMPGRLVRILTAAVAALLGVALLAGSDAVAQGVRRGLEICGGVLIPALFPFMALCCFLTRSDSARILSLPLSPLTTHVFKLPGEVGVAVLLGLVGGYPVGAKMVANLLDQGRIDKRTAERMLCFCVNVSPSFLISAVGSGMLLNRRAGVALFVSQAAATLLVGAVASLRAPKPDVSRTVAGKNEMAGAFVSSVTEASTSMLNMCALAVLFSALMSLISHSGLPGAISGAFSIDPALAEVFAAGLLEVSGGCLAAAKLGGGEAILLISVFCSWGGLSVIFQVISCFGNRQMRFWPFLLGRLAHCALAAGMALPLCRAFSQDIAVMLPVAAPVLRSDSGTWLITICLLCMCGILVAGSGGKSERKKKLTFYADGIK